MKTSLPQHEDHSVKGKNQRLFNESRELNKETKPARPRVD
jgi:hypothetical protein